MIIVAGATGALNGATVDHLLDRIPADEIVVAVRDPAKAQRFVDRGVAVRRGDYADPDSLPRPGPHCATASTRTASTG